MSEELSLTTIMAPDSDYAVEQTPEIQAIVSSFHEEAIAAGYIAGDDGPTTPEIVSESTALPANLKDLSEQLGGTEAVQALAELINDPTAKLEDLLPAESVQELVWSALENPASQDAILNDPNVRMEIERRFLNGHSIEDVQELLNEYQSPNDQDQDERHQSRIADIEASESRVQEFQRQFFSGEIDDTINNLDVDQSNVEAVTDRLIVAQHNFLARNNREFLQLQSMHECGLVSQARLAEARLHSKWTATLLSELNKLPKAGAQTKAKATTAAPTTSKSIDLNSPTFAAEFLADFKAERAKRGI